MPSGCIEWQYEPKEDEDYKSDIVPTRIRSQHRTLDRTHLLSPVISFYGTHHRWGDFEFRNLRDIGLNGHTVEINVPAYRIRRHAEVLTAFPDWNRDGWSQVELNAWTLEQALVALHRIAVYLQRPAIRVS